MSDFPYAIGDQYNIAFLTFNAAVFKSSVTNPALVENIQIGTLYPIGSRAVSYCPAGYSAPPLPRSPGILAFGEGLNANRMWA